MTSDLGSLQEYCVTDVSHSTQDHSQGHTCNAHTACVITFCILFFIQWFFNIVQTLGFGYLTLKVCFFKSVDVHNLCAPMVINIKLWIIHNIGFFFTWEDVSIVPLSRGDDAAITQSHWTEWTATGKKTSTLWDKETQWWVMMGEGQ